METKIERLGKNTTKVIVTVHAEQLKSEREKAVEEAVKNIEISGFRKGQAPRNMAEPKLDQGQINGSVINTILPQAFSAIVKEHLLRPIAEPKIEITQMDYDKGLIFEATIAERPEVKIGDYKASLHKLGEAMSQKSNTPIVYGPDGKPTSKEAQDPQEETNNGEPTVAQILEAILSVCEIELPPLIVEQEVARMMSRLLDQTQALGLSVEQYLQSIHKTSDDLKMEYGVMAENNLKAEFAIQEVAKMEEIVVSEDEINEAIKAAPDEESRMEMEKSENKLYIASIIQKSQTLQRLVDIAQGKGKVDGK